MDMLSPSPLIQLLTQLEGETRTPAGELDVQRLRARIASVLHVEVPIDLLRGGAGVASLAGALKEQVDHPGRLERLAERLLTHRGHAGAA
jgi:hypothetical protein